MEERNSESPRLISTACSPFTVRSTPGIRNRPENGHMTVLAAPPFE
jgi:hypothetical protein